MRRRCHLNPGIVLLLSAGRREIRLPPEGNRITDYDESRHNEMQLYIDPVVLTGTCGWLVYWSGVVNRQS